MCLKVKVVETEDESTEDGCDGGHEATIFCTGEDYNIRTCTSLIPID